MRGSHNETRLKKWIAKQKKGYQFTASEIDFSLGLTSQYLGNTFRWINGVKNTGITKDGKTVWEITHEPQKENIIIKSGECLA